MADDEDKEEKEGEGGGQGEEEKEKPSDSGDKEKASAIVEKAVFAADRIEKANELMAKHIDRLEALKVHNMLGGDAEAGVKSKSQEDLEIEDAKKVIAGSGFETMLDPDAK